MGRLRRQHRRPEEKEKRLDFWALLGIVLLSFMFYGVALAIPKRPKRHTQRQTTVAVVNVTRPKLTGFNMGAGPAPAYRTPRARTNAATIAKWRAAQERGRVPNGALRIKNKTTGRRCNMEAFNNPAISRKVLLGKRKYTSCAVVGSSGKMVGASFGKEIDGHAFVVRHNNAPTEGFEADVGGKTSMMIQSSSAVRVLYWADERGEFECPQNYTTFYTAANTTLKNWLKHRCANITSPAKFIDLRDYINHENLSRFLRSPHGDLMAGPTAILVALRVCKNPIDLYGFTVGNVSNYAPWPYHYYNNVTPAGRDHFGSIALNLEKFIKVKIPGCINVRV